MIDIDIDCSAALLGAALAVRTAVEGDVDSQQKTASLTLLDTGIDALHCHIEALQSAAKTASVLFEPALLEATDERKQS